MNSCPSLFLSTLLLTAPVSAASNVDGFDGFKWGTVRGEIEKRRGEIKPFKDFGFFPYAMVYDEDVNYEVAGYRVDLVIYHFYPILECETKDKDQNWCPLSEGVYDFAEASEVSFKQITDRLVSLYGPYIESASKDEIKTSITSTVIAFESVVTRRFELENGTTIKLSMGVVDRDYVEVLFGNKVLTRKAGPKSMTLSYKYDYLRMNELTWPNRLVRKPKTAGGE